MPRIIERLAALRSNEPTVQPSKLPIWSKILIGGVLIGISLSFAFGVSTIYGMKQIVSDMVDLKKVALAGAAIAQFPDPLPEGFHYQSGLNFSSLNFATVTIQHEPDKQMLTFSSFDPAFKDSEKEMLDFGYVAGLNIVNAKFTDVIKRGTEKVLTYTMPYILAHAEDLTGRHEEGMVGALRIPTEKPKKNILIYSLQTSNVPYNQQITMELLNSIKSF